jgi:ribosomal protein S18 acetylase RimI-like enzyme
MRCGCTRQMWRGTSVYRTHDGRPTAPCPVLQIVGVVSARLERCERLVDTFNPFGSEKWLGYIMTIGVAEVYRCRGIGSRLLQVRRRRPAGPVPYSQPYAICRGLRWTTRR